MLLRPLGASRALMTAGRVALRSTSSKQPAPFFVRPTATILRTYSSQPPPTPKPTPAKEDAASSIDTQKKEFQQLSIFGKMKRYGPPAIFIYLVIHCAGFWLTFFLVSCGFPIKALLADFLGGEENLPKGAWAELLIALAVNKMFSPFQALLTVAITPKVAPILTAWGPTQRLIAFVKNINPMH